MILDLITPLLILFARRELLNAVASGARKGTRIAARKRAEWLTAALLDIDVSMRKTYGMGMAELLDRADKADQWAYTMKIAE